MSFWDTSALLSLLAEQTGGPELASLADTQQGMALWWSTRVELVSGVCRLHRQSLIDNSELKRLLADIEQISSEADGIEPTEEVRQTAFRLLRVHDLRAADALQLAAALVWTGHQPDGISFVCLDKRLRSAAEREGFAVLPEMP